MGNEYSQELIDLAFASLDHGITRHVLAYDGYVKLPTGERSDAIYAEGVEADSVVVMGLAQRYRPKRPLRKFEAVGNPMLLPLGSSKLDL